jgi:4-amino-4-deoxy-L-arabinose transferase-like glycosyltransferase
MTKIKLFLKYVLLAVSVLYLLVYFYMVYYRIRYPFELEWIEGGLLGQVQRIVNGQVVYAAPSLEFVAFIYPPLFFYLSALASQFFGATFFSLRLVSFLASLTSYICVFLIVKEETDNKFIAFISACFLAATFRVTGAWMDIGRIDSLFVALLFLFVYFIRHSNSTRAFILAGFFAALTLLTKQTALVMCIPAIGYAFLKDWKRTSILIATATAITGGVTLAFNLVSDGWYVYYVFELLGTQTEWLGISEFVKFWPRDLLAHGTITLVFLLIYFSKTWREQKGQLLGVIFLSILAGTYMSRVKLGGYDSVLMPLYGIMAILMGLGSHKILEIVREQNGDRKEAVVYFFLIVQMAILVYNPFVQIPSLADVNAGQEFVQYLSSQKGRIYIADHPYLLAYAGKETHAHNAAVDDVLRGKKANRGKALLNAELSGAIKDQTFAMIISDTQWDVLPHLEKYYEIKDYAFKGNGYFYPITGVRIRPTHIYFPKVLQ